MMAAIRKIPGKNGSVSYKITVSLGRDVNGKQIRKFQTWTPEQGMTLKQLEKELDRRAILFEEHCRSGEILDTTTRFADFTELWLERKKDILSPAYQTRVQSLLERINQGIGHIQIGKLKPHHLQTLYANLAEPGINKKSGGCLSGKTILHHHRIISSILESAVKWQVIFDNPARRVEPPKAQKKEAAYLDDKQALEVIYAISSAPLKWRTAVMLLIYSGMRRGELCGLSWGDVDFENEIIHIRKSSQYLPAIGIFDKETKTESSARVIKLPPDMFSLLNEYRLWQSQEQVKCGDLWYLSNKVFTQDNGKPLHPDSVTQWIAKFRERENLPYFTPHSLRHTSATLLIMQGVPVKAVSARLGHASQNTTNLIYSHAIKTVDAIASDVLGDILGPIKKKPLKKSG